MNARNEFLKFIGGRKVVAAHVSIDMEDGSSVGGVLRVGFSAEDFNNFLNTLDVEYDGGYGTQVVYGTIWFEGEEWGVREEYDGSEWWGVEKPSGNPRGVEIKKGCPVSCGIPLYVIRRITFKVPGRQP